MPKKPAAASRTRWRPVVVNVIYGTVLDGVETDTKRRDVRGYTYTGAPGLAVTPCIWGGEPDETRWNVTHIQSGRALPGLDGEGKAMKRALLQVAKLGNFDLPMADLVAAKELHSAYFAWRREWRRKEEEEAAW